MSSRNKNRNFSGFEEFICGFVLAFRQIPQRGMFFRNRITLEFRFNGFLSGARFIGNRFSFHTLRIQLRNNSSSLEDLNFPYIMSNVQYNDQKRRF